MSENPVSQTHDCQARDDACAQHHLSCQHGYRLETDLAFCRNWALVSSLVFAYIQFLGFFDATLYTLFAAVCPPSLLCIPLSDVMKEKGSSYAIWLLIGLTNAGLYAVVGSAYVGLQNKQIDPTTLN